MPSQHFPSLQIECSLVFQPSPVIRYAANLLAVVIRDGILHGRTRRIDAEFLDALVELFLLLLRSHSHVSTADSTSPKLISVHERNMMEHSSP